MNALVLGGTGPTGPLIVNGLLKRGYEVTIMHGGFHEAEFDGPVEDLHGDVHFAESLQETLGDRQWDLVVFMYGRLRVTAEFMIGKTKRFIAVGAAGGTAPPDDPRWGPLGRPFMPARDKLIPMEGNTGGLGYLIQQANLHVLELHNQGHYNATIIAYPNMYGPRQMAPEDWCVVKRILDGRRQIIVPGGGIKIHQRAYTENVAHAVMLAVDKPKESAGQLFVAHEQPLYTIRQRIELIAKTMGVELELIDIPFEFAIPSQYLWFLGPAHVARDDSKIREVLGYTEQVELGEAMIRTTNWLIENRAEYEQEWNDQIDETFDYEGEDELIRRWKKAAADLASVEFKQKPGAHRYRHPKEPGEEWKRPERTTSYNTRTIEYY